MRKLLVLVLVLVPVIAAAQDNSSSRLTPLFLQPQGAQQTARPQAPKEPPPPRPKPEGSMVGYIENAIVGNEVRFRFDAGSGVELPDRAEFFYAKCGCYKALAGLPAYDPNAPGPQPGIATNLKFQQLYVNGEYAPTQRISFFAEIPVRWLQPKDFVVPGMFGSFGNHAGLSDIRTGVKLAMVASDDRYVTFQFRAYAPTGDASEGLGTDHATLEPSLLYYQKLGSRGAIESEFSFWHPISGSAGVKTATNSNPDGFAGNVLFYGIGPSYELYNNGSFRFAPVVELAGWRVLSGSQTVWIAADHIADPAEGTNIVNLKMGGRVSVGARSSIYLGYGRGLTDSVWYKNLFRAEYRYSF